MHLGPLLFTAGGDGTCIIQSLDRHAGFPVLQRLHSSSIHAVPSNAVPTPDPILDQHGNGPLLTRIASSAMPLRQPQPPANPSASHVDVQEGPPIRDLALYHHWAANELVIYCASDNSEIHAYSIALDEQWPDALVDTEQQPHAAASGGLAAGEGGLASSAAATATGLSAAGTSTSTSTNANANANTICPKVFSGAGGTWPNVVYGWIKLVSRRQFTTNPCTSPRSHAHSHAFTHFRPSPFTLALAQPGEYHYPAFGRRRHHQKAKPEPELRVVD
jgi:hypothetical protein